MQAARWVATALFFVAVPLFLVLTNVRIATVEPRVHEYSFSQYDAVARSGIDRAQLDRAAREIIRYFRDDEELLAIRVTVDGVEEPLFSPREVLHMRDVKGLIRVTFRLQEVAFVYIIAYVTTVFLWSRERPLHRLARQSLTAGAMTVGLLSVAAVGVLVGFDDLFRQFHVLSFSNDFWQLSPARDHLIQMYPRGFWFDVTLVIGLTSAAEGAVLALLGYAYLARQDRRGEAARPLRPEPAAEPSA